MAQLGVNQAERWLLLECGDVDPEAVDCTIDELSGFQRVSEARELRYRLRKKRIRPSMA